MMKYKSIKHIEKNMADHRMSKDTQNINLSILHKLNLTKKSDGN